MCSGEFYGLMRGGDFKRALAFAKSVGGAAALDSSVRMPGQPPSVYYWAHVPMPRTHRRELFALLKASGGVTQELATIQCENGHNALSEAATGGENGNSFEAFTMLLAEPGLDWNVMSCWTPDTNETVSPLIRLLMLYAQHYRVPLLQRGDIVSGFKLAVNAMLRRCARNINGTMSRADLTSHVRFSVSPHVMTDEECHARMEEIFSGYGDAACDSMSEDGFRRFYAHAADSRNNDVWADLHVHGYGTDLEKCDSPFRTIGDVAIPLIGRMSDDALNAVTSDGVSAMYLAVRNLHVAALCALLQRMPGVLIEPNLDPQPPRNASSPLTTNKNILPTKTITPPHTPATAPANVDTQPHAPNPIPTNDADTKNNPIPDTKNNPIPTKTTKDADTENNPIPTNADADTKGNPIPSNDADSKSNPIPTKGVDTKTPNPTSDADTKSDSKIGAPKPLPRLASIRKALADGQPFDSVQNLAVVEAILDQALAWQLHYNSQLPTAIQYCIPQFSTLPPICVLIANLARAR